MEMWVNDGAVAGGRRLPRVGDNVVFVRFKVIEPILMSPFTFGSTDGKAGFYGIQTLNFQMNMQASANRAWRSACVGNYTKTARVTEFTNSRILLQLLTPHASQMLTSRNVVPYYELPVYRTGNLPPINGIGDGEMLGPGAARPAGSWPEGQSLVVHSSNIQLNGIPDKLVIFVRDRTNLNCSDPDRYLTIENCRINFNNQAGLLSSMTHEQLYTNSVLSGLRNMTFDEFTGLTLSVSGRGNGESAPLQPLTGLGSGMTPGGNGIPGVKLVSTTGSILVLNFAEVIQLTDEYYAPGSLGTFNLQVTLQVRNNHRDNWPVNSYEMIIIPINSGVFVNERGTSSTFLSLLTKQDVLSSLGQPGYTRNEIGRMIGGSSFTDKLHSALKWVGQAAHRFAPMAKNMLASTGNPYASAAATALGALGYGQPNHKALENRVAS